MDQKSQSGKPLLYVNQPDFKSVKPVMQHVYQSSADVQKPVPKKKVPLPPLEFVEKETEHKKPVEEPIAEKKETKQKALPFFTELKPFRKMTLTEKMDYLHSFAGRRAPYSCIFTFNEGEPVNGYLHSIKGELFEIKTLSGDITEYKKKDLQAIMIQ
ncbi:hypothetical protein [Jeotgalibacillus sp. R-1-5s-1]|uniref:hypothetical protein n=1 Tax=Jeotgalibacillus sp. R-1-5s-1 TaxID=2555897 RepID=UPI00106C0B14|nr:hypothetical protein [Jeotgalibacillus sp. R-1-5s-1]TFD97585.1 hypothetical protein E2491_09150 [Jeotgalibacillus sp. R-1-5s-1]